MTERDSVTGAEKSHAPWTDAQVLSLLLRQNHPYMHPYTCPRRGLHVKMQGNVDYDRLAPTNDGWVCPHPLCDYEQGWAHASDVAGPVL